MKQIMEYLHQKVPKAGKTFPAYFQRALATSEIGIALYFVLTFIVLYMTKHRIEWTVILVFAAMLACRYSIGRINVRLSFYAFEAVIIFWCAWHTQHVGWEYGAQHLLIPMLMLCFFNIYEPPTWKVLTFFRGARLPHLPVFVCPDDSDRL